jgi:hypothetical protein
VKRHFALDGFVMKILASEIGPNKLIDVIKMVRQLVRNTRNLRAHEAFSYSTIIPPTEGSHAPANS